MHVVVAWYQAGRGQRIGCERQLEKAERRLARRTRRRIAASTVAALLRDLTAARERVAGGSLDLV